jgi:hypothetical protein
VLLAYVCSEASGLSVIALYQHFSCNVDNIGVFYPRCRPCLNPGPSTGSHTMRQDIKNIAVEDVVLWTENPRDPISASVQDHDLAVYAWLR